MASQPLGTATGQGLHPSLFYSISIAIKLTDKSYQAKLEAVTHLLKALSDDLDQNNLGPKERSKALEELKIYGRDPENAGPVFARDGITTLCAHAGSSESETRHGALRVLSNCMLLKAETRQMVIDLKFPPKACDGLCFDNHDDEFLNSRVIFFCTYAQSLDLEDLIDNHQLAIRILTNLDRHDNSRRVRKSKLPMEGMALNESLKLLFNVTHFCNQRVSSFDPAIGLITRLFSAEHLPGSQPLDPPFGSLIHALINLNLEDKAHQKELYGDGDSIVFYRQIIKVLDDAMKAYEDNDADTTVTPVITLLTKMYEHCPDIVKAHFRELLLPSASDREHVLGTGDSLPSRLLRNSTNPMTPRMRDAISKLFFDLSDQDASKFVQNVGYGFAAGYLFQNNVPIPESAREAFTTNHGEGAQREINPITGQFLDREAVSDTPEMTQEEREREAERLFVLFERLRANGVIDVENPVATAVREGRFRELQEDDVEELD